MISYFKRDTYFRSIFKHTQLNDIQKYKKHDLKHVQVLSVFRWTQFLDIKRQGLQPAFTCLSAYCSIYFKCYEIKCYVEIFMLKY